MLKKILTFVMLIFVLGGVGAGIYFAYLPQLVEKELNNKEDAFFEKIQIKQAEVTEFFTYGKCFNLSAKILGISKDNFESAKLCITDKDLFEQIYKLDGEFVDNELVLSTTSEINTGLILDDLVEGEYIALIRLKLNNSVNPKYYSLKNISSYNDIEYYTVTKEGINRKVDVKFDSKNYKGNKYDYLSLKVAKTELPMNVYDFAIDAGHGGTDTGEKLKGDTEANITLSYANLLKNRLEAQGLKVKLTRDELNTNTYTATNMYDANGRITVACESNAKYMISFHINNGNNGLKGVEIYSPCKSNLEFAQNMANKIISYTEINYSNNNSFKKGEGVYVRNFTKNIIDEYTNTANKKGYEPYSITLETPYLFTIREVGGIATNAYVDGRNKAYAANKYYNFNRGIECYQIEMGYIKNDLQILKTQIEQYVTAISEAVLENLN